MTPSPGRARRWRRLFVAAAVAVPVIATSAVLATANAAVPTPPAGWTTVFSDDFSGAAGAGLNTANWLYDTGTSYPGGAGNWGTGEVETVTNSTANVYQDGSGHLVIKPIRDAAGNWTSGRVETQRTDFAAPVGGKLRIEAALQQPNVSGAAAAGYWPAFWTLGAAARPVGATNWPSIGEIDIMEDINGRSSEFATLHCGVGSGGPCNETTGLGSGERACAGCQTGFHTYAMEYDRSVSPEQIRWYLDGVNFFTLNSTAVDATTWNNATHHGFFAIFNVAMGGAFPAAFGGGPTAATQSGVPMLVDYVTVLTSGGGSTPSPTPTATATSTPTPTPTPTSTGNPGSATRYLLGGGGLGAAGSAATNTVASAGGGNHDGTPTNPVTYTATGLTMSYTGGTTAFDAFVDSGSSVGNGVQARISYDLTGDGSWDRVETYNYFATDPVAGFEHYTQARGLASSSGALGNLVNGRVQVQVWSAIGTGASTLGVGNQSVLQLPFTATAPTTTPPSTAPPSTTPPAGNRSAYSVIQAESYNAQSGTTTEATTDSGGGQDLGALANGDWVQYTGIDFGSTAARQFVARVASGAVGGASGLVEVRLDALTSAPIGSFGIANTGGWQSWQTVPANITGVTGVHTVYLTFTSGQPANFVNLNYFTFGH